MCGRFTSRTPPDELAAHFGAEPCTVDLGARFNVAPTDDVYAVAEDHRGGRRLGTMRWGLVPPWAGDPGVGGRMINARAETAATRPAFRSAMARRRCIVPADGFYEWQAGPGRGAKQPWHIRPAGGGVLAFAGLWEAWRPPVGGGERGSGPVVDGPAGDRLVTCTILTTVANDALSPLHGRMPVVLPARAWDEWLDAANDDVASVQRLLVPAPAELFDVVPVSTLVNHVANEGPALLEPVAPAELFPPA